MNGESFGTFGMILIAASIIVSICVLIAIFQLPKIARYHKATMKLTALMAYKLGVSKQDVQDIIAKSDEVLKYDKDWIGTLNRQQMTAVDKPTTIS